MKLKNIATMLVIAAMGAMTPACDDNVSYADLLVEQDHYVNNFLADQQVILEIPEDTVFICGEDAPFYLLDEDHTLYMQVLNPGTKGNMVVDNEQIYFRYTRYALANYNNGKLPTGSGNNITLNPCWFRYNNYQIQASYNWGTGIQRPLSLLPVDCEINLVMKAEQGFSQEASDVQPYLYKNITYERRQ